ncbi:MAG: hypothetical protein NC238_08960 [Dehalobacter sp.]|nr:hypothetical protein [Dehalobacter sp.]
MDTLFPPTTDKEKAELALAELRKVLGTERKMREWVFKNKPEQRAQKLREIDGAIKAVGVIEGILNRLGVL